MNKGISPKFDELLDIKYILVKTGYNNRALADLDCMKIMRDKMQYFGECQLEELEASFTNDNEEHVEILQKNGSVYILPPEGTIRLLYTNHIGYTWIDKDKDAHGDLPIYTNQNDITYVNNVRMTINDRDSGSKNIEHMNSDIDKGCFVFECSEIANIMFKDILLNFVIGLTEMNFCGFFVSSTLYEVKYYPNKKAIVFEFGTESG